ncbi:hypothetical protein DL767_011466 [Monosporascus sp. MG133]|nr:hypothetical protein DL767_011466 [Monosporascus sp. MG133]
MLAPGPNAWKVVVILEELGVPYEIKAFKLTMSRRSLSSTSTQMAESLARTSCLFAVYMLTVAAVEDPNSDLVLWESGALIRYLIEQYAVNKTLTYDSLKEKHHLNQWLQFQMSSQGPYYGVASWFNVLHPEKLPSAIERYNNLLKRVLNCQDDQQV